MARAMAAKGNAAACEESPDNLRKLLRQHKVVPFLIRDIVCSAGSAPGDNYMSVVRRVQISGGHNNGDKATPPQTLSVIIKRQIPCKSRRNLYRCDEAYSNEIKVYTHMVPLLEQYCKTSNSLAPRAALFPKFHFADKDNQGEIIVMEDLRESGYRMQDRREGLNLRQCELVMKQLGRLHAASLVAKQLNGELFREKCAHIHEVVYGAKAEECYKNMLESSVEEALRSLRISNEDGCLSEPIRRIEQLQFELFRRIQSSILNTPDQLNVMCHGDLYINNIMFVDEGTAQAQHDEDAVKFFDLQAMRHTSPVFDILHFIFTSTKLRTFRENHTETLLQIYCTALSGHLKHQLRCTNDASSAARLDELRETFSLENISAQYYDNILYGLYINFWVLPAITFDPHNIPDLDEMSEANTSAKEIKCTKTLTAEYHSRLRDLALEFYENGYLPAVSPKPQ